MANLNVSVLGGSFDPVHKGHLFIINNVITLTELKKIIVIPAALSNFKQDSKPCASESQRFEMLTLAVEDFKDMYPSCREAEIEVSDIELVRGGVSYTFDTVKALKNQYGITERIGLIIGDDHISGLKNWYRFNELKDEVEFIICRRNPDAAVLGDIPSGVEFRVLDCGTLAEESSTAIRNSRLAREKYLSARVFAYVEENNLYL